MGVCAWPWKPCSPVPSRIWSTGVGAAGSASKGGRRVLGRGGLSLPAHTAEKLLWHCISPLQSPSQPALAEHRSLLKQVSVPTAGSLGHSGRCCAQTSAVWTGKEQRLWSSSRGTVCAGLAIQRNEGSGVRNAGSEQESGCRSLAVGTALCPCPSLLPSDFAALALDPRVL